MKALITGASTGIGRAIAIELAQRGHDLIIVARDEEKLNQLKEEVNVLVRVIPLDLSKPKNSKKLYQMVKDEKIDILINNAGYGKYGAFEETSLSSDLNMMMLNMVNLHLLTKLFLKDFVKRDRGYILNVSSSAGFMVGGPLMSVYYATKSYVSRLSSAIYEELRRKKSNVKISLLCPGPVKTNFNNRAGVEFSINSLSAQKVAKMAVNGLFKNKFLIVPGITIKMSKFLSRFVSDKALLKITYGIQHNKNS